MSVSEKKKILDEIAALPPQLRRRALDIVTGAKMGLECAEKKEKEEAAARVKAPNTLTLSELDLICRKFHIEKEKIVDAFQECIKTTN